MTSMQIFNFSVRIEHHSRLYRFASELHKFKAQNHCKNGNIEIAQSKITQIPNGMELDKKKK